MKETNESKERDIQVVISGINRFFGEGYIFWSKENMEKIFKGNIDEKILKEWENIGLIKILGGKERYVKVVSKISGNFDI